MPEQTTHPSPDELGAYSIGQLPPDEAAVIESHISECQPCCETIVALSSSDDTFVALLQEARQLPADQTVDQDGLPAKSSASLRNVPGPLAEHPRYEIIGLIGKGGMGDVYKARHRMMDRAVALKIINRDLVREPEAVDRFHREVKTAARLTHPNIVTAYDAEQAGDVHFLVMEYVYGVDLAHTVKDQGALPITKACDYVRQAAIGLQYAHEMGMVHRDIKPHNLMVTAEGTVKILDFGLASLAPEALSGADTVEARGDLTAAGSIMGTPDFISPEQADDARAVDIRSDIYSLGCSFYFLLTGRPPFTEGSPMERVKAHGEAEPEPIETFSDGVPAELCEIVRCMMAKDPAKRFQTPAEVADVLAPFVDTHRTTPAEKLQDGPHGRSTSSRISWWPPTIARTLVCAALAFALAGVIYVATDNGTLVIESEDDNVDVVIRPASGPSEDKSGSGPEMRIVDTVTGSTVKRLRSGEYVLAIKGNLNGFELNRDRFVLKRGGQVIVKVTRKPTDSAPKQRTGPVVRQVWGNAKDLLGAVAPDGRYVSFVDWDTGDLATRDLVNGRNRRVTNTAAIGQSEWAEWSKFSRDSKRLVYEWFNKDGSCELRTVSVNGGDSRVIYSSDDIRSLRPMDWSPDGSEVLALLTRKDKTAQIALVSVEEQSATILKSLSWRYPEGMSFSPDGRYVVYDLPLEVRGRNNDVFVIAVDGSSDTPIIEHPAEDTVLGWSPDGNWILFSSDRTGTPDAWVVKVADGKCDGVPVMAKPNIGHVLPMGFTLDGAFYFAMHTGLNEISTASFDPQTLEIGPLKNVARRAHGSNIAPEWSASGDLAYLSEQRRRVNIVILPTDGPERELTPELKYITPKPPAWSPDGRRLLVSGQDIRSRGGLFLVDVDTGAVERVVSGRAYGEWTPDGTAIYVHSLRDGRIYSLDLETKQEQEIVHKIARGQSGTRFLISPDGKQIAFTTQVRDTKSWVLMLRPIDGGDDVQLYDVPNGRSLFRMQWASNGQNLIIGERVWSDGDVVAKTFSSLSLKEGLRRELKIDVEGVQHLKLHPDGNRVAVSVRQKGTSEISAMENILPATSGRPTSPSD